MNKDNIDKHIDNILADNSFGGNGYGNECHKFGIMCGCKPECPVFMDGKCEIQEENERIFGEVTQ